MSLSDFLTIDFPSISVVVFCAASCGLAGNFLVLRRQALFSDAISHVVFPGIVVGFLLTGSIATLPLVLGAIFAALISIVLIQTLIHVGDIEKGAAMGIVFTAMFAGGIILLEQTGASNAHIDTEHALYGNLESVLWIELKTWSDFFRWDILLTMPRQLATLFIISSLIFVATFFVFKELKLSTFDPGFAYILGFPTRFLSGAIFLVVALAAVASFEIVGSIMVIAMFICPAATARMITDSLSTQLILSVVIAVVTAVVGYLSAAFGPQLWGSTHSLSAAGMIAVVAGIFLSIAMITAPKYGVLSRAKRARGRQLDLTT